MKQHEQGQQNGLGMNTEGQRNGLHTLKILILPQMRRIVVLQKSRFMILYNVTVNIDEKMEQDWLNWMINTHIPDVMNTGMFLDNKICRILAESEGGVSYSVQYLCKDMSTFEQYESILALALRKEHSDRYAGHFAAFRTLLEVVHHSGKL
jgi:hypothetical protein